MSLTKNHTLGQKDSTGKKALHVANSGLIPDTALDQSAWTLPGEIPKQSPCKKIVLKPKNSTSLRLMPWDNISIKTGNLKQT